MEGEPWFNAKDAATNLGYKDTPKAIANNVHVDDKKDWMSYGGNQIPVLPLTKEIVYILMSRVYIIYY
jgi:prophage antirepressor-like protein